MMTKRFFRALSSGILLLAGCSPRNAPVQLSELDRAEDFLRETFIYPDRLPGSAFEAEIAALRRRVSDGISEEEFISGMQLAFRTFGDAHTSYIPHFSADRDCDIGVGWLPRDDDGSWVVGYIDPSSYAADTGLRVGDRLLPEFPRNADGTPGIAGVGYPRFAGAYGSFAEFTVISPAGEVKRVKARRYEAFGTEKPYDLSILPDSGGKTGFLRIREFSLGMAERFPSDFDAFLSRNDLTSLVVDLRYNPGGYFEALEAVLGYFDSGWLFSDRTGDGLLSKYIVRKADSEACKDVGLCVLVNRHSVSMAEVFAGVAQSRGIAMVLGEPSAGFNEARWSCRLSMGTVSVAGSKTLMPNGERFPWSFGPVRPDYSVDLTVEDFLEGERSLKLRRTIMALGSTHESRFQWRKK